MFEYYGWVNIQLTEKETYDLYDSEIHEAMMKVLTRVKKKIAQIENECGILTLKVVNANYIMITAGYRNHRGSEFDEILELFELITSLAKESYGTIYTRDEEDPDNWNKFQVYRIAKGTIELKDDTLLSPCIPVIFDDIED